VHLLALLPFLRYALTGQGARLSRLGLRLILRDADSFRIGVSLLRNFVKRLGAHLLLERVRRSLPGCDVILCDEGAVHAAHNLFVHTRRAPRAEEIAAFADLVPKPDLLVWVTAPPEQSVACTLRRGHRRVAPGLPSARAFVNHANIAFTALCSAEVLRERLVVIDNSAPELGDAPAAIRDRAEAVADCLIERLRRSSPLGAAGARQPAF
jgi:hypothetical protein